MPITALNHTRFHKTLYAGELQKIVLYKRGNDQAQGTVRTVTIFDCRRGKVFESGQPLRDNLTSTQRTTWHIPATELRRQGVDYLKSLDIIHDPLTGDAWQPEADTTITVQLLGLWVRVECKKTDPVR